MIATSVGVELVQALAWPAVVVIGALIIITERGSRAIRGFAKYVQRIKGPGFELDLRPETAGQVKVDLESAFSEYREVIRKRFDAVNHQHDVKRLRDRVAEDVLLPCRRDHATVISCTIYVPDIVFEDALYRLTDYYPGEGVSGKVYSIRFGIIGRQWRLRESKYECDVPTDEAILMRDWGMTKSEAHAKSSERAFAVIMLEHDGVEQGLLFVASEGVHAFESDIIERVTDAESTKQLAARIALVNEEMRNRGPALKLFET